MTNLPIYSYIYSVSPTNTFWALFAWLQSLQQVTQYKHPWIERNSYIPDL